MYACYLRITIKYEILFSSLIFLIIPRHAFIKRTTCMNSSSVGLCFIGKITSVYLSVCLSVCLAVDHNLFTKFIQQSKISKRSLRFLHVQTNSLLSRKCFLSSCITPWVKVFRPGDGIPSWRSSIWVNFKIDAKPVRSQTNPGA